MRKISIDKLNSLFSAIAENETLYLPVDTKAGARFEKWHDGAVLSDALNTVRSAKDFFFPQTENLMDFKVDGKNIEIIDTREECEDFVLFGVRACDVKSFEILDRVFLAEPVDSYYKNRREHGVIMSLACTKPHETCFCGTFGIDASSPEGDIVCHMTGDALCMDAKTEKGKALLSRLDSLTEETDGKAEKGHKGTPCKAPAREPFGGQLRRGQNGEILRRSRMEGAFAGVSRLRNVYLRLPDVSVLRHKGLQHRSRRKTLPLLGLVHVFGLYENVRRSAETHPARTLPSEIHA